MAQTQGTGSLTLPVGTTAQRPSSAAEGMIRRNTTDSAFGVTPEQAGQFRWWCDWRWFDAWVAGTDQTVTTSYELGAGKPEQRYRHD